MCIGVAVSPILLCEITHLAQGYTGFKCADLRLCREKVLTPYAKINLSYCSRGSRPKRKTKTSSIPCAHLSASGIVGHVGHIKGDKMTETWFPIARYHGKYQVSNLGHVRNARTGREVCERTSENGVRFASLKKNRKSSWEKVRDLVAETLLSPLPDDEYYGYLDGNPANCARDNLIPAPGPDPLDRPVPRGENKPLAPFFDRRGIGVFDALVDC